jgi:arsenite methyltransferase
MSEPEQLDKWAEWLLHRRDGDDEEQRRQSLEYLVPIRDRVLDNARLSPGDVVLDVGAGEGLIAFGAIERVTPGGNVVLSDISEDLVDHARSVAEDLGVTQETSFLVAPADDLSAVGDASVDAVTTRSVLIYVANKARAFSEFARVLKPGGRLSIFEPINSYFPDSTDEFCGCDSTAVRDLVEKVYEYQGWLPSQAGNDPMMNFRDEDLVGLAEMAGFSEIALQLDVQIKPSTWVVDWDRLLTTAPNPNAHTMGEALEGALTPQERDELTAHIRPLVDAGEATWRSAEAFLAATK